MCRGNVCAVMTIIGVVLGLAGCHFESPPSIAGPGNTQIADAATIQADPATVNQILTTFNRAEEALRRQDFDALISMYSKHYNYDGIDITELRDIWQNLFNQYRDFSSTHVFSSIAADRAHKPPTAEITCTGSLWAISRVTGRQINIDTWQAIVHHLVYEDGAWRIQGHARDTRYELRPHPLF